MNGPSRSAAGAPHGPAGAAHGPAGPPQGPAGAPQGPADAPPRRVLILGSTGSIGRQALEIVAAVPGLGLAGLAADRSAEALVRQARETGVGLVALRDEQAAERAREALGGGRGAGRREPAHGGAAGAAEVLAGEAGIAELIARAVETSRRDGVPLTVLNGIVGAAGLRATMAVLESGATLALANKESLVAGGEFVLAAARRSGARILPVDSEHSAVFQCLLAGRPAEHPVARAAAPSAGHAADAPAGGPGAAVAAPQTCDGVDAPQAGAPGLSGRLLAAERIVLTGSGGPFRGRTRAELADVTPEQALRHPTWSMGRKITIDSATLMNKGLEVIEAHHLFGVPCADVEVLISPQSLVHAMVRFADGATVAHLGLPDMRTPIAFALTYPGRAPLPMVEHLDLAERSLTFQRPDAETFGCLRLAYEAGCAAGAAPVVLNAANEVAVEEFLTGRLSFLGIEAVVEESLLALGDLPLRSLADVFAVDGEARRVAASAAASRLTV